MTTTVTNSGLLTAGLYVAAINAANTSSSFFQSSTNQTALSVQAFGASASLTAQISPFALSLAGAMHYQPQHSMWSLQPSSKASVPLKLNLFAPASAESAAMILAPTAGAAAAEVSDAMHGVGKARDLSAEAYISSRVDAESSAPVEAATEQASDETIEDDAAIEERAAEEDGSEKKDLRPKTKGKRKTEKENWGEDHPDRNKKKHGRHKHFKRGAKSPRGDDGVLNRETPQVGFGVSACIAGGGSKSASSSDDATDAKKAPSNSANFPEIYEPAARSFSTTVAELHAASGCELSYDPIGALSYAIFSSDVERKIVEAASPTLALIVRTKPSGGAEVELIEIDHSSSIETSSNIYVAKAPSANTAAPIQVNDRGETPADKRKIRIELRKSSVAIGGGKTRIPVFVVERDVNKLLQQATASSLGSPVRAVSWHRTSTAEVASVTFVDDGAYVARYAASKEGYDFAGAVFVSQAQLYILGKQEGDLPQKLAFEHPTGYAIAMPGGETAYQQNNVGEEDAQRSVAARKVLDFIAKGPQEGGFSKLAEDLNRVLLSRGPASVEDTLNSNDAADVVLESLAEAVGLVSPYDDGGARSRNDIVADAAAILGIAQDDIVAWSRELVAKENDIVDVHMDRAQNGKPEYKSFIEEILGGVRDELLPASLGLRYEARYELLNGDVDTQWLSIALAGVEDGEARASAVAEFATQLHKYAGVYAAGNLLALLVFNSEIGMFAGEERPVTGPLSSIDVGRIVAKLSEEGRQDIIAHPAFRDHLTPIQNREINKMTVEANYESAIAEMRNVDVINTPYEQVMDLVDRFDDIIFGPAIEMMAANAQ